MRELRPAAYDADVLTARRDLADYFEAAVAAHRNPKAISNWVMGDVLRLVRDRTLDDALVISDWPVPPESLGRLVALIDDGTISGKIAKAVFEEMVATGRGAARRSSRAKGSASGDRQRPRSPRPSTRFSREHPDKVAEYHSGKDKLFGFLVGQVMKATQGKANPQIVNQVLREELR